MTTTARPSGAVEAARRHRDAATVWLSPLEAPRYHDRVRALVL